MWRTRMDELRVKPAKIIISKKPVGKPDRIQLEMNLNNLKSTSKLNYLDLRTTGEEYWGINPYCIIINTFLT